MMCKNLKIAKRTLAICVSCISLFFSNILQRLLLKELRSESHMLKYAFAPRKRESTIASFTYMRALIKQSMDVAASSVDDVGLHLKKYEARQ